MTSIGSTTPAFATLQQKAAMGCDDASHTAPAKGLTPNTTVGGGGDAAAAMFGNLGPTAPAEPIAMPAPYPMGDPERFVSSMSGGVIVGADGAPAGTVPPQSFIDTKDGSVYKPDGTKVQLPAGASVDFFDLPDLATLREQQQMNYSALPMWAPAFAGTDGATGVAGASGGGATASAAPGKGSQVAGASGSGTSTPATKAGGTSPATSTSPTTSTAPTTTTTAVGGVSGAGAAAGINSVLASGALAGAAKGAGELGTIPGLQASLTELIKVLQELVEALSKMTPPTTGSGPGKVTTQPVSQPQSSTPTTTTTTTATGASEPAATTPETTTPPAASAQGTNAGTAPAATAPGTTVAGATNPAQPAAPAALPPTESTGAAAAPVAPTITV